MVSGDSEFMTDRYIRNNQNMDFFLNIINWLVQEEDLISIRPKEDDFRKANLGSKLKQNAIFYINILVVPSLIIIYGLIRWQLRRRKKIEM